MKKLKSDTSLSKVFNIENNEIGLLDILNPVPAHVYIKDKNGKYLDMNLVMQNDCQINEFRNMCDFDWPFLEEEKALAFRENDLQTMREEQEKTYIEEGSLPNNNRLFFISKKKIFKMNGKLIGIIGATLPVPYQDVPIRLTNFQQICLYHLAKGKSAKQIAHSMHLSPRTIEHHLEHLKKMFKCSTKFDLIEASLKIPAIKIRILRDIFNQD